MSGRGSRGRGNSRGSTRGNNNSNRGSRGRGRGGRGGFQPAAFPEDDMVTRSFASSHRGLGFNSSTTSRGKSSPFVGAGKSDRALLQPIKFVRGVNQDLIPKEKERETLDQPMVKDTTRQSNDRENRENVPPVQSHRAMKAQWKKEQTESASLVDSILENAAEQDENAAAPVLESNEPASSATNDPASSAILREPSSPQSYTDPIPITIVENVVESATIETSIPENSLQDDSSLFMVDTIGDHSASTATKPSFRPIDSDSEEDHIVYIAPSQRQTPVASSSNLAALLPRKSPPPSTSVNYARVVDDSIGLQQASSSKLKEPLYANVFGEKVLVSPNAEPTKPKTKLNKKAAKREGRQRRKQAARRDARRMLDLPSDYDEEVDPSLERREGSDVDWGSESAEEEGVSFATSSASKTQQRRGGKKQAEMDALTDYLENTLAQSNSDGEEQEGETGLPELSAFERGVLEAKNLNGHLTIDDLNDMNALDRANAEWEHEREMMGLNDDWETESGSASQSEEEEAEDDEEGIEIQDVDLTGDVDGESSDEESEVGRMTGETTESGDSDDEEEMFTGKNRWAMDVDELDDMLAGDPDLLTSKGDRKRRKQIFKAVTSGDFTMFDDDDEIFASSSKSKKRSKKPQFDEDDEFMDDLQAQWEKDRNRKAQRKRERLAARLENNPTKANKKKAKRAGLEILPVKGINMHVVHADIVHFLQRPDIPSLSLSPMSKKDRIAVHLLAECYSLSSSSKGSGHKRFPMLHRTARTSLYGADKNKIDRILGASTGSTFDRPSGGKGKGRIGALWKELEKSDNKSRTLAPKKNRDGEVVGKGAAKLADDNRGFRLLAMMGWEEGQGVGLKAGRSDPLSAVFKASRSGIGA